MSALSSFGPRCCLTFLLSLAVGLVLIPGARAGDFLDQVKRQNQVERQKVEAEVAEKLAEARQLERTNLDAAAGVLRKCQTMLDVDQVLDPARRGELQQQVASRLRNVQEHIRVRSAKTEPAPAATDDPRSRYQATINNKRPNPADQAKDFIKYGQTQQSTAERLKNQREQGTNAAFEEIARASIPSGDGPVSFPANWKERMDVRKRFNGGPQMTAEEKKLVKAMNSVLSVDFDKTSFQNVIDILQEKTGQTILLDKAALEEANVQYDDPVTFKASKVTVRTILRKILQDRNLAYILKDGIIQVVTVQRARETLVTHSYPIGDLLPPPQPGVPPFFSQQQAWATIGQLIQTIQTTVEPSSWRVNGGTGTIMFNPATMSLVIRNSAELHYSMMSGMFGH